MKIEQAAPRKEQADIRMHGTGAKSTVAECETTAGVTNNRLETQERTARFRKSLRTLIRRVSVSIQEDQVLGRLL